MKIAVTYDEQTGEVFQHFGHSDAFKIYEFDESGLTGAMVLNTSAINGHEAMASFLAKGDVKVLICGGVGEGAMLALSEEGILVVPGVSGDADLAVAQFLPVSYTHLICGLIRKPECRLLRGRRGARLCLLPLCWGALG